MYDFKLEKLVKMGETFESVTKGSNVSGGVTVSSNVCGIVVCSGLYCLVGVTKCRSQLFWLSSQSL